MNDIHIDLEIHIFYWQALFQSSTCRYYWVEKEILSDIVVIFHVSWIRPYHSIESNNEPNNSATMSKVKLRSLICVPLRVERLLPGPFFAHLHVGIIFVGPIEMALACTFGV